MILEFDRSRYSDTVWLRPEISEHEVESDIIRRLGAMCINVNKYDVGNAQGRARGHNVKAPMPLGQCDLMGTGMRIGGVELCIEVKRPGCWSIKTVDPLTYRVIQTPGKIKPEQVSFLERKALDGAICVVAWDWSDVERALALSGKLRPYSATIGA
jgi:hypothetical protein